MSVVITDPDGDAPSVTEDSLVEQALGGDLRAFEALYRRHSGRTYALALRMSGDPRDAEEATQDVWVRAWERLGTFEGRSSFTTWLHRLTVNLLVDRRRSWGRRNGRSETLDHPDLRTRGHPPERTEDRLDLERALEGLPDGARTMFVLHEIEGLKCREIAEATGRAVGTVKAQLHRARTLLKEALT
jgi:RNA polymerase sigma-70 factor, ECF subfamily